MADWKYEFLAHKSPAGLVYSSPAYFDRVIGTLGDGEEVRVTVAKPQDKRSLQANRALWGSTYDQVLDGLKEKQKEARERAVEDAIDQIAPFDGIDLDDRNSKEWIHEGYLQAFSGTVINPITGLAVARERSSTMTVARFSEFMEFIARRAAEQHGIVITLPGER